MNEPETNTPETTVEVPETAVKVPENSSFSDEEVTWTRYARVVDGVVMEEPIDYPRDPNTWFSSELSGEFFLCPDTQVKCWWLYDVNTQIYSPPLPVTLPPYSDTTNTTDLLTQLKNNPELLEELKKLLMK